MAENKDEFQNWSLPEVTDSNVEVAEENSLFGKPATWYNNQDKEVEQVEAEAEQPPQPLTLDDIEAIRQVAYEDGFNEGKESGLSKGIEQGKLEGLAAGHKEGLAQGLEEGLTQGKELIDKQATHWHALIERLHNPLEKLDDNVEYQLIHLATALAEQITRCEVKTDPQIILQALKQAVDALPISEQKLIINLHPEDLLFVQNAYSQEQCLQRGWELQAEPTLKRGDCQIHTQVSSIDYAFNTRINQVLKKFFKENHGLLPSKNDDSNLLNDQPLPVESQQDKVQTSEEASVEASTVPVTEDKKTEAPIIEVKDE
ncbi:flagellar assembly protein FliH [Psychromonas hadalis]|uniref:flagellar assembly protein FliH n=1 Tax=Psychromonas hadalis TaxID=211669 RepID=UPI0003B31198|nr:flagellar assembly protein FliH [Psychromonas hadalis]